MQTVSNFGLIIPEYTKESLKDRSLFFSKILKDIPN